MLTRPITLAALAVWTIAGCGGAAAPAPPHGTASDPTLRGLDGVYAAEITRADLRRMRIARTAPAGVWKIAVRADQREMEVSAPEGRRSGGYTLAIQHVRNGRLTLGPDRTCERPASRNRTARVAYSLRNSTLVFTYARGGCPSTWLLLRAIPWHKA